MVKVLQVPHLILCYFITWVAVQIRTDQIELLNLPTLQKNDSNSEFIYWTSWADEQTAWECTGIITVGGWVVEKKIHSHAQLQLIAATTNCRVRLYTCKILVIITPTTGSHSHWLPVWTQRLMLFLAASTPYMTGISGTPKATRKSVNIPVFSREKNPKCSEAAAE